jgi:hypothetical protein
MIATIIYDAGMDDPGSQWLLLVVSLPSNSATARMRVWRALKALGCGALRDGAYLLPYQAALRQQLTDLSEGAVREGGSAWLLTIYAQSDQENDAYRALFDRSTDYAEWVKGVADARKTLSGSTPQEINRMLRKLRRDYETVRGTDYFPSEGSADAEGVWKDFVTAAETMLSPGEPHVAVNTAIARRDLREYQGRTWATRHHLWADRVASAWLIRRFIDRNARFVWLASPADCPADVLSFDFEGATFTHIGDRVTFEVLLASFALGQPALNRIGALVHYLDVGGIQPPESTGIECVLTGLREAIDDDDHFLAAATSVFDGLLTAFEKDVAAE